MNDQTHDRFEELYEQARALHADARAAFLAEACGGDNRLARDLLSLLQHGEPAEAFFATLASAVVSPSTGHRIGHYRLVGMLGAGGMGTVYRAHDERLDRMVALKFLPPYLSAEPEARERFLGEARAAAALDHPNVCTIHEIGETADGRPFIAMTCYEGETLKERLSREPLSPKEATRIAVALGHGLAAAHARGIVHRDVKPGNVMLCADGTVKLLDFGLAKVAAVTNTGPGVTQGTIAYMSPEQARGDPVDARTDLWSLGVVLYEMLAGIRPFRGANDRAVIESILHDTPEPLQQRPGMPASLPRIVTRLLAKARDKRHQSAADVVRDLTRGTPAQKTILRATAILGATALLAFGVLRYRDRTITPTVESPADSLTIAVLPFTVRGPGLEVWRDGMVDLLSIGLDGAGGIRAVDSRTLLARWHQEIGNNPAADLQFALGVARRSHARFALIGGVVAAGQRLRLSASIYDVVTGQVVGPVEVEGSADSTLTLVDRVGMQALGIIFEKHPGKIPTVNLASITTNSLLALNAYLEGEDYYRRAEFPSAATAWERAVRADTLFALADLGLADARAWIGDYAGFMASLGRARRLKEHLPARERAMMAIRWDRETGADVLSAIREALGKYPDAADLWYQLGEIYYHDMETMGRPEDAAAAFEHAAALQPMMAPYWEHLLELAFRLHADSAAIASALAGHERAAPQAPATRAGRIVLALGFGDSAMRANARVALRTLDSQASALAYHFMAHPFFAGYRNGVYDSIESRLTDADWAKVAEDRFRSLGLTDGRIQDALAALGESRTPPNLRFAGTMYLSQRGMPVPDAVFKQLLSTVRLDSSIVLTRIATVSAAGTAARVADWTAYNTLVTRMRNFATRARAAGDSARAEYWGWALRVTEAHRLWRQGRKEEALRQFETTLSGDSGWLTLWDVGELSLELGRLDRAERAFRALVARDATPAYLQLARILARTGRAAEARDAYRFVADAWRHADPELQPQVDEADRAIGRLSLGRHDTKP